MNKESKIRSHKRSSRTRKGQSAAALEVPLDDMSNPEMTPQQIKEGLIANIKGAAVNTELAPQPQVE